VTEPWGQPPPPGPPPEPPWEPPPPVEHPAEHHVEHHEHHHHDEHRGHGYGYGSGYGTRRGMELHDQVRTRYGRGISVADLLAWLDFRVTELHGALLEGERHPSRVPGSPVRMSGLDALLNTDATAFRTLTELSARMDRIEEKLDRLLEK
jgi:hypothetical protein